MDTVKVEISVPLDTAVEIRNRLKRMQEENNKAIIDTEKKLKVGNPDALAERERLLHTRRMLNDKNLLRVATMLGIAALAKVSDVKVLHSIREVGVSRGRPRNAA